MSFKKHIKGLKNSANIRIAYSVFESSQIPPEWTLVLNYYFDAVAVPDQYLVDVYKNSGVTIPIFVLPYPVNLDTLYQIPLKNKKNSPFIFANFSDATPEKNHITLIRAFHKTFGSSSDVKLKLYSSYSDPIIETIKKELRLLSTSNIEFIEITLSEELYLKTIKNIDCYVNLSQGEGCAIQPKEAMALGIPVILSNNTAQSVLCNSSFVKPVSSLNKVPGFYSKYQNTYGVFYDCSIAEASQALRDVYEHYDEYLERKQRVKGMA
ncbi:MAG: glycosyltransferase [Rhabdochlamydiaceae bacterium]